MALWFSGCLELGNLLECRQHIGLYTTVYTTVCVETVRNKHKISKDTAGHVAEQGVQVLRQRLLTVCTKAVCGLGLTVARV